MDFLTLLKAFKNRELATLFIIKTKLLKFARWLNKYIKEALNGCKDGGRVHDLYTEANVEYIK